MSAPPDADLADAIHRIRERALRQAMAMVNRLQPDVDGDYLGAPDGMEQAFRRGHRHARMQLRDEIERMIAREAPLEVAAETQPTPMRSIRTPYEEHMANSKPPELEDEA